MPTRDELLDALAHADHLALAAHLRAEDGPVRDVLVELRGHLRGLAEAVELRPYRWLRPLGFLAPFTLAVAAGAGLRLALDWYLAVPAAALAAVVFTWPIRPPRARLAPRDVPAPEAVGLAVLLADLSAATARVTAVVGAWRLGVRPPAPLALHADACLARLEAGLAPPAAPAGGLDALRPVAPWIHALAHDAHGGSPARLARMDAAHRLVAHHAPSARTRSVRGWIWLIVLAAAYAAAVPWPWLAVPVAVAAVVLSTMRSGPDSCPQLRTLNRASDAGAVATEAARKLEEIATAVGGPVAEDLRRARDLLRGRGRT
ncbi:hypothetical protein [Phytomonospora endophytica]|uniref:Uncharacterized protein n=1 Tax=Phytomonospora endophytica TaxID=714109 RepID=A0A841FUZ0_9ACTN|nr:hypothetical protein [Phytomonospora endophytica]MBB6039826.1 hypothetical protein [Phytomonospora endophytica]GIG70320.1 hypothetical protein Pen01_66150 [Phytomonospora endophytica]